jgi:hypothetical protein
VAAAYVPRDAIREGEELRVRFLVSNESRHEGTIYYVVNVRNVYDESQLLYSSDLTDKRYGHTACVAARDRHCIEHSIPWQELTQSLPTDASGEIFLAIEIELWTPGRVRIDGGYSRERSSREMFQRVELMHNPSILLRAAAASCFISYAWTGHNDYRENDYRAWVYRLADSISRSGLRPIIDYNFLSPALVNREVIRKCLKDSEVIILVYSDDYVARMADDETGVGYEYGLIRSGADLWSKTFPIRRGLRERTKELFRLETRFVEDFEGESMIANATALVSQIVSRLRGAP